MEHCMPAHVRLGLNVLIAVFRTGNRYRYKTQE